MRFSESWTLQRSYICRVPPRPAGGGGRPSEVAQGNRMGVGAGGEGGHQEVGMWVPVCDVIVSRNVSATNPPPTAALIPQSCSHREACACTQACVCVCACVHTVHFSHVQPSHPNLIFAVEC